MFLDDSQIQFRFQVPHINIPYPNPVAIHCNQRVVLNVFPILLKPNRKGTFWIFSSVKKVKQFLYME